MEEPVWRRRHELINDFEAILAHGGTTTVKLFLHISKEEQRRRLDDRRDRPDKRWKLRAADWDDRAQWTEFLTDYEEALTKTTASVAPWYVVPADHKWFATGCQSHPRRQPQGDGAAVPEPGGPARPGA